MTPLMAVVQSLRFDRDHSQALHEISPEAWRGLLPCTDEAQLTLPLAIRRRNILPEPVRLRVEQNLARNAQRHERVVAAYEEVADALRSRTIEFISLKGLTHWPLYCDDLRSRPQYDIDLYCPPQSISGGRTIASLGYEPIRASRGPATDHLPSMIRKTGFRWRGDYYDPEMPLTVELHFRFWNPAREFFEVSGAEHFWERRSTRMIGDRRMPALDPVDDLSYTTWHLVRHLLRGDIRLYHVYELAHFLERTAPDDAFWREWSGATTTGMRLAEPIAFQLATEWFGCRVNPVVQARSKASRLRSGDGFVYSHFHPCLPWSGRIRTSYSFISVWRADLVTGFASRRKGSCR